MTAPVRRTGILTGGGDCPGLNAVIRAVAKAAHVLVRGARAIGTSFRDRPIARGAA